VIALAMMFNICCARSLEDADYTRICCLRPTNLKHIAKTVFSRTKEPRITKKRNFHHIKGEVWPWWYLDLIFSISEIQKKCIPTWKNTHNNNGFRNNFFRTNDIKKKIIIKTIFHRHCSQLTVTLPICT